MKQNHKPRDKSWLLRHKWLIKAVGLLIFAYIVLFQIDIGKSLRILANVQVGYLLLSLCLGIPAILIKAIRWWTLLRKQDIGLSLKDAISVYCIGLFGGFVTPGQLGDFVKVYYLRKGGQSLTKSFSSVLYDRLFDVLIFCLFGVAGLFVLFNLQENLGLLILVAALVVILGLLWLFREKVMAGVSVWYVRLFSKRLSERIRNRIQDFVEISKQVFARKLFRVLFGYSFVAMALYLFRVYLLAVSLQIEVPVWQFLACISVVSLITLVPISVADVGTRDGALILLLARFGIDNEYAISLSLLILLLAVMNGVIGFIFWIRHPLHSKSTAAQEYELGELAEKV